MADEIENEQENETIENENPVDETASQESESSSEESSEFNPAEIEERFGLASGELATFKDEASALAHVSSLTDNLLSAGLGAQGYTFSEQQPAADKAAPAVEQQSVAAKMAKNKAQQVDKSELDALRAELSEIKTALVSQHQANQKQLQAQLDSRIRQKIDSWKSPTYGTTGARKFTQNKAEKEIRELLYTHVAGLQATGRPIPEVEVILDRVRLVHDSHFTMPKNEKKEGTVGTPGTKSSMASKNKQPANIHEAYQQNPT